MYYLIMNNNTSFGTSSLIEPGIKYFIGSTLKECHRFKFSRYSFCPVESLGKSLSVTELTTGYLTIPVTPP